MTLRPDSFPRRRPEAGFTLIEVMVVVVIVALLGGISMLALQQALSRPVSGQAERLQLWLEELADRARLQGTTYGVLPRDQQLQALVFYRDRWLPLREPAPFTLEGGLALDFQEASRDRAGDEPAFLPVLTLSDAGMEPEQFLLLRASDGQRLFRFHWQSAEQRLARDNLQGGAR